MVVVDEINYATIVSFENGSWAVFILAAEALCPAVKRRVRHNQSLKLTRLSPRLYLGGWAESGLVNGASQANSPRSLAPPLGCASKSLRIERSWR